MPMPTIEERLQALEKEVAERKHSEEMLTIAVRALVSKEAFEKLQETVEQFQEQSGKLFNVIINQNALHNERLTNLQGQVIDLESKLDGKVTVLDNKITGLQTEMGQRFAEQDHKITGLQTTQAEHTTLLHQILARLPEQPEEKSPGN
jgi:predicted RNase H-like nuclease (RuvC/YqgF family)